MSDALTASTALIGPVVPEADGEQWTFIVITGGADEPDAQVDMVNASDPRLLSALRDMLRCSLCDQPHVERVSEYADELDLARAAAALWPKRFASMVAFGEVYRAGGGQA